MNRDEFERYFLAVKELFERTIVPKISSDNADIHIKEITNLLMYVISGAKSRTSGKIRKLDKKQIEKIGDLWESKMNIPGKEKVIEKINKNIASTVYTVDMQYYGLPEDCTGCEQCSIFSTICPGRIQPE